MDVGWSEASEQAAKNETLEGLIAPGLFIGRSPHYLERLEFQPLKKSHAKLKVCLNLKALDFPVCYLFENIFY